MTRNSKSLHHIFDRRWVEKRQMTWQKDLVAAGFEPRTFRSWTGTKKFHLYCWGYRNAFHFWVSKIPVSILNANLVGGTVQIGQFLWNLDTQSHLVVTMYHHHHSLAEISLPRTHSCVSHSSLPKVPLLLVVFIGDGVMTRDNSCSSLCPEVFA